MSNIDLLDTVLASEGYYCVVGIRNGDLKQSFHETREEVDSRVEVLKEDFYDAYFALARFETPKGRTKDNVKLLRSFWLDIDCGEDKAAKGEGYVDQAIAIQEIARFCELVGLPMPTLVNSGRGVHAYWHLTKDVTRAEWEPVGKRLAQLCVTHKLLADPSVFEVARILRIPGTYNFKDDPPLPVEVLTPSDPVHYEDFKATLGVIERLQEFERPEKREYSELGKMMQDNIESSFFKIMRRSLEGKGCAQLADCYNNRTTLSEPRWFNALSVAKFCKDSDKAIHKMSAGHPDYDPSATEQKIQHIKGPHTCVQFDKNNPGICEGCPFNGKIGSPISLGKELSVSNEEVVITDQQIQEQAEQEAPEQELAGVYKVPKYPEPFFRGKNGGIYFMPAEEEAEPVLVYEHDIYVVKRMEDPIAGELFVIRRHLPRDGVKQFNVLNTQMVDKTELQKIISKNGVLCYGKPLDFLLRLLISMAKNLQIKQRSAHMRLQFGWADNDTKFIIGDREITAEGVFHSPPSNLTMDIAVHMHKKGTIEKWKEVFDLYGRPGLEPNAFGALTAFGAPLLKFTGQKGSIINVIHPRSGTGKTTTLLMCNSVYGAPDRLYAVKDDTLNAKIMRLGIMNNLPFTADEMTNITSKDLSTLAYNMSQGRGKDRVKSQSNELRQNMTSWQTISLTSSNSSYYEKLTAEKASPDGEMMRLLEYKIEYSDAIDPTYAKQMFDHQLMNNYGHAGDIYAGWLVGNLEEAKATLLTIQSKIDKELKLTQRERCWSAAIASNITGGLIAKQLGLIDWDMKAIYKWVTSMLANMREEVVQPVTDIMLVIGEFLNRHMQNMLVINEHKTKNSNAEPIPMVEPKGDLIVRFEPDSKRMYIAVKAFRDDCVKHQVNYSDTVKELKKKGILLSADTKRLATGMKIKIPGVHSLTLDAANPDFVKMDNYVPVEETNAGREG